MSKVILAADLHSHNWTNYPSVMGTRLSWCIEALKQIDDYAHKNKIDKVILAGDTFHTYGKVDAEALYLVNKIVSKAHQAGRTYYFILGNHEVAIKSDLKINILDAVHHAVVVDEISKVYLLPEEVFIWLVPYYPTREEYLRAMGLVQFEMNQIKANQKENGYILISHVAVEEFMPAPSNSISSYKVAISEFPDCDHIFLGHYHNRQQLKNVRYLGAPIQHALGEDEAKGFWIFDAEKKEVEFHEVKLPRIKKLSACEIPLLEKYGKDDIIIVETESEKQKQELLKKRPQTIVNLIPKMVVPESRLSIEGGESLEETLVKYLDYNEIAKKEKYMTVLREVV